MCKSFWLTLIWCQVLLAAKAPNPLVGIVLNDVHTENYVKDIVTLLDIHLVNWQGRRVLNGFFQYNQVIPHMYIQFSLTFEKPDKTRFEVLDLMIDVCSFLNGTYSKLKIPKIVLKELIKQKGFPKSCPIEALLVDVVLHDLETEVYLKDILPHMDVTLVQRQGRKLINGSFTFAQALRKLPIIFSLHFEKPDKRQLHAMDFKADACEVLNGVFSKQTLPKLALKELNKQSGFPKKCPIVKNKTYGLDYFEVNSQHFPLPNLKFQVVFTLFTADEKRKIIDVRVKGATKRYKNYF